MRFKVAHPDLGKPKHTSTRFAGLTAFLSCCLVLTGCQAPAQRTYSSLADASSACYRWRQEGKTITIDDTPLKEHPKEVDRYKTYDRTCTFDSTSDEYIGYISEGAHNQMTTAEMVKSRKQVLIFRIIRK